MFATICPCVFISFLRCVVDVVIVMLFQNNASIICGAQSKHNTSVNATFATRSRLNSGVRRLNPLLFCSSIQQPIAGLNGKVLHLLKTRRPIHRQKIRHRSLRSTETLRPSCQAKESAFHRKTGMEAFRLQVSGQSVNHPFINLPRLTRRSKRTVLTHRPLTQRYAPRSSGCIPSNTATGPRSAFAASRNSAISASSAAMRALSSVNSGCSAISAAVA